MLYLLFLRSFFDLLLKPSKPKPLTSSPRPFKGKPVIGNIKILPNPILIDSSHTFPTRTLRIRSQQRTLRTPGYEDDRKNLLDVSRWGALRLGGLFWPCGSKAKVISVDLLGSSRGFLALFSIFLGFFSF